MGPALQLAPGSASLDEVLDTVREFGCASLGLVAWDLWLTDEQLRPVWEHAVRERLITPAGRCPQTAEPMFAVADPDGLGR